MVLINSRSSRDSPWVLELALRREITLLHFKMIYEFRLAAFEGASRHILNVGRTDVTRDWSARSCRVTSQGISEHWRRNAKWKGLSQQSNYMMTNQSCFQQQFNYFPFAFLSAGITLRHMMCQNSSSDKHIFYTHWTSLNPPCVHLNGVALLKKTCFSQTRVEL